MEAFKGEVSQVLIRRLSSKTWYLALLPRPACTSTPTTSKWYKRQNEFLEHTVEYDGISMESLKEGIVVREETVLASWLRSWIHTQEISLGNRFINWHWASHFRQYSEKPLISHAQREAIKDGNGIAFCPWPLSNFPSACSLPLSQQSIHHHCPSAWHCWFGDYLLAGHANWTS